MSNTVPGEAEMLPLDRAVQMTGKEGKISYLVVAYIHRGEEYTVLDKDVSSTGSVWYKIKVGQKCCWISSGLVDQG